MLYYIAKNDHVFYSKQGHHIFDVIKNELITERELEKALLPYNFNLSVVRSRYFDSVQIPKHRTHFSFGVREAD